MHRHYEITCNSINNGGHISLHLVLFFKLICSFLDLTQRDVKSSRRKVHSYQTSVALIDNTNNTYVNKQSREEYCSISNEKRASTEEDKCKVNIVGKQLHKNIYDKLICENYEKHNKSINIQRSLSWPSTDYTYALDEGFNLKKKMDDWEVWEVASEEENGSEIKNELSNETTMETDENQESDGSTFGSRHESFSSSYNDLRGLSNSYRLDATDTEEAKNIHVFTCSNELSSSCTNISEMNEPHNIVPEPEEQTQSNGKPKKEKQPLIRWPIKKKLRSSNSESSTLTKNMSDKDDRRGFNKSFQFDTTVGKMKNFFSPKKSRSSSTSATSESRRNDSTSSVSTDMHNSISTEDIRGLTKSFTSDSNGKEKKHVLIVPRMTRSQSSNAISHNSKFASIENLTTISNKERHSTPGRSRSMNNSTSTEDIRGLTKSFTLDSNGKEKKHVLIVPRMTRSQSSNAISHNSKFSSIENLTTISNKERHSTPGRSRSMNNSTSTEDIRGLTKSFTLDSNGKEKKHVLIVPRMTRSQSSSAISPNSKFASNENLTTISNKERHSTPGRSRSMNNSTSTEDIRGFTKSFTSESNGKEKKHVLIVPRMTRSQSTSSIQISSNNRTLNDSNRSGSSMLDTPAEKDTPTLTKYNPSYSLNNLNSEDRHGSSGKKRYSNVKDSVIRPDSGYVSPDESKKESRSYTITFTPENNEKKDNRTNSLSSDFALQGLVPLVVGLGIGEEEQTRDVVTNLVSPHAIEEHGYFNIGGNHHKNVDSFSSPTSEKDNSFIQNKNSDHDISSNSEILAEEDEEKEQSDDNVFEVRSKELNEDVDDFCVLLDTNYSYPQFSSPNKDSESETTNQQQEFSDLVNSFTNQTDIVDFGNNSQINNTTPHISKLSPSNKQQYIRQLDFKSYCEVDMKQGSSNGQLPKFEELHHCDDKDDSKELLICSENEVIEEVDSLPANQNNFCSEKDYINISNEYLVISEESDQEREDKENMNSISNLQKDENLESNETSDENSPKNSRKDENLDGNETHENGSENSNERNLSKKPTHSSNTGAETDTEFTIIVTGHDVGNDSDNSCDSPERISGNGMKLSVIDEAFEFNEDQQDSSLLEDSTTSFEDHEKEYMALSQNGYTSKDDLSIDEEDDNLYRDYNLSERSMTMELLNYMPSIIERSAEVNDHNNGMSAVILHIYS